LSVARGSDEPGKLIILKYTPSNAPEESEELLAFVGKGITFDSGGISLKPGENMELMKYDMTGGATVMGAMRAVAQLKPSISVLGVIPCAENLPSGKATKPGDVVRAMTGKTIEVINTDAEGRLILADAIAYAKKLGATKIIDMATLTGAVSVALGDVNTDGHLDIVATATATGPARAQQLPLRRALTLLLGDGRGGFQTSQIPMRTGEPWFVAISDINGDRKPDLVVTHHEKHELTVLLGDGAGRFREAGNSPLDTGHNAYQIVLADVNRDGRLDVVATAGDGVRVMLGDGSGGFKTVPHPPLATGKGTWRMAVGDINRDGEIDVVTCNSESKTVSVLLGN